MKNNRRFSGFTLAEVLIVVAITVVLAGVGFVSVFNHMRSLVQLERDTIAKEIFVAAQNHLTTAESQGYLNLGSAQYGLPETIGVDTESQNETGVYYLVIPADLGTYRMFELMLPFGAVDETVRAGGSYIIRYQPAAARILDVFYCARTGRFVLEGGFEESKYNELMTECYGEEKKSERKNYNGAVVGWYGGEASVEVGERLTVPTIEIINAERLQVKVTDTNQNASLQLIITGEKSQSKKVIWVRIAEEDNGTVDDSRVKKGEDESFLVTLDDITSNSLHFCQLSGDLDTSLGMLLPGENISIQAIAFSKTKLTNVARSQEGKTNSLFGYDKTAEDHSVALISNIRHLENLDSKVSKFTGAGLSSDDSGSASIVSAKQTTDLIWPDFIDKIKEEGTISTKPSIYYFEPEGGMSYTVSETYKPVTPDYTLKYNGNNHSISEVKVDYVGDAGIFGSLTGGSVSTLLVRDSDITSSSSSGTSSSSDSSGNAGGLIGSMSGTEVKWCAANGTVNSSSGAAGGLIGSATSGTVTACYSGGHTDGPDTGTATYYSKGIAVYDEDGVLTNGIYNVTSEGGYSGGLIGDAGSASISYSYSTCSAKGTTVGGLIGTGSGSVTSCYATGLVKGSSENATGAFAGSFSGAISTDENTESYYYQIINEIHSADGTISYLHAIGNKKDSTDVKALDETADSYNKFVGSDWKKAVPFDKDLETFYQKTYNLPTVVQLGAELPEVEQGQEQGQEQEQNDWFITTHYGDWPAPEIFVINTGTGSGNAGNGNGGAGG